MVSILELYNKVINKVTPIQQKKTKVTPNPTKYRTTDLKGPCHRLTFLRSLKYRHNIPDNKHDKEDYANHKNGKSPQSEP